MKKLLLISIFCLCYTLLIAQRMGIRIGLSQSKFTSDLIEIGQTSEFNSLKFQTDDVKNGLHFGLIAQYELGKIFFIQPEVLFNFNQINYYVEEITLEGGNVVATYKETYTRADVPISIGLKLIFVRLYVGGIAHFNIDYYSDFEDNFKNYKPNYKLPNFGWHYGMGIDLPLSKKMRLLVDIKHEKSIDDFGDGFEFEQQTNSIDQYFHRHVLSAGLIF